MDPKARAFAKKSFQEGSNHDEVKQALISHGFSTENFQAESSVIQSEAGVQAPVPQKTPQQVRQMLGITVDEEQLYQKPSAASHVLSLALKVVGGVLVLGVMIILYMQYGQELVQTWFDQNQSELPEDLTPTDVTHAAQLRSFQISADAYKKRLLEYTGMCGSIGIDRSVFSCQESSGWYVIEVPLSYSDTYYCVDSNGFANVVAQSRAKYSSCK